MEVVLRTRKSGRVLEHVETDSCNGNADKLEERKWKDRNHRALACDSFGRQEKKCGQVGYREELQAKKKATELWYPPLCAEPPKCRTGIDEQRRKAQVASEMW
jgi:hypothetical protein